MKHRHEWTYANRFDFEDGTDCKHCKAWLGCKEIKYRLNATEFLSAEDAQTCASFIGLSSKLEHRDLVDMLDAYAKTLRGGKHEPRKR